MRGRLVAAVIGLEMSCGPFTFSSGGDGSEFVGKGVAVECGSDPAGGKIAVPLRRTPRLYLRKDGLDGDL